jgi:hypothetical protein
MNFRATASRASASTIARLCARTAILTCLAAAVAAFGPASIAQYSTIELTNSTAFTAAAQQGFGKPAATDGTYAAYSTGTALWVQPAKGGKVKRLFVTGQLLPESSSMAEFVYPQVVLDNGVVVFLAAENPHSDTGLFGLYSIKADGSEPAKRVFDSTTISNGYNWSADMDAFGYSWVYQASHGVAVIALEGILYSANLDGSDLKTLWEAQPGGFTGCNTVGTYGALFLADAAYLPATNGTAYAFAAGSTLEFEGLYQGPLTTGNSCDNLINTGINDDFDAAQAVKILPGQPVKAGPFAFPNTFQGIQIDGSYVYFGASVTNGASATEDYTGFFKVPLAGGKAEAIVTNLSHLPGIVNAKGEYDQVQLMGFAVKNGRFVFMAEDATPGYPGVASFYMADGSKYVTLFSSGSSVSNSCVGALDAEYAAPGALDQVSLSSTGLLAFAGQILPATYPNEHGPCSYPQGDYIHDPVGYYVLDTMHPLIATETGISLSAVPPITYGEKPSLKIEIKPAGAANPKHLVPTGTVSVWFTNPEYFGQLQPKPGSAKLNADGEATISLGAQQIGTYTYVVTYGGDTNFASSTSENLVFPLHVTAPTFSVPGKQYSKPVSVNITDPTPGSTIYYTLNGSTPTTKSKVFETTLTVSKTETIKAMATAAGDAQSAVITETYTIK